MNENTSPGTKIMSVSRKALGRLLHAFHGLALVVGIAGAGTLTILLWGLAGVLAVLAVVPLALGAGTAALCGWYVCNLVDADVSDALRDYFAKTVETSSDMEGSLKR